MLKAKTLKARKAARAPKADLLDSARGNIRTAHNAVLSAVIAMEGKGVFTAIAHNLRYAALTPLDHALNALGEGR